MDEIINRVKNEYTKSKRKEVTFKKLSANRSLSYDQMDRLKTAEALYECIPITIYTPFAIYFLRKVGQANSGSLIVRFLGKLAVCVPMVEIPAQYTKEHYYWPIVR